MQKKYLLLPFLLYVTLLGIIYNQIHTYAINQAEIRVEDFLENYQALRTYIERGLTPKFLLLMFIDGWYDCKIGFYFLIFDI
jgi:hypothetical protein